MRVEKTGKKVPIFGARLPLGAFFKLSQCFPSCSFQTVVNTQPSMDAEQKQREHHAPRAGSKANKKKATKNKKNGVTPQPKSTHPGVVDGCGV